MKLSTGVELDAGLQWIPGLQEAVNSVEEQMRGITGCSTLVVVRIHFLDQENTRLHKHAARQAGFKWHTDKSKEFAEIGKGKREFHLKESSILFTVVARIGGLKPSALQVLGFKAATLHEVGNAHAFPSMYTHATATLGGHKVAFFLGWVSPLYREETFSRYQDML